MWGGVGSHGLGEMMEKDTGPPVTPGWGMTRGLLVVRGPVWNMVWLHMGS